MAFLLSLLRLGLKHWKLVGLGLLLVVIAAQSLQLRSMTAKRDALALKIDEPVKGYRAQLAAVAKNRDDWTAYAHQVEAVRDREHLAAVAAVKAAAEARQAVQGRAYDNGYSMGRAAGLKLCKGSTHETGPAPGPAVPGRVRDQGDDFSVFWAARAYKPSGAMPSVRSSPVGG